MYIFLYAQVFDLCRKMRALAVLFRRGRTHPLPESLELNLRARKRSLEDQDDLIWARRSSSFLYLDWRKCIWQILMYKLLNFIISHCIYIIILYRKGIYLLLHIYIYISPRMNFVVVTCLLLSIWTCPDFFSSSTMTKCWTPCKK